jgi:hypothetical protein
MKKLLFIEKAYSDHFELQLSTSVMEDNNECLYSW